MLFHFLLELSLTCNVAWLKMFWVQAASLLTQVVCRPSDCIAPTLLGFISGVAFGAIVASVVCSASLRQFLWCVLVVAVEQRPVPPAQLEQVPRQARGNGLRRRALFTG